MLFGVPARKDAEGSEAWNPDGHRPAGDRARSATEFGDDAVVIADLCLDEYTDHGHCGVLTADGADVDNDETARAVPAHRDRPGGGRRRTWWGPAA